MAAEHFKTTDTQYKYGVKETLEYIAKHSLRLTPVQQKLVQVTQKHAGSMMMGDPSELQFLQNLLRTMKAKKVLEIGVYTGCGTLSFALTLPNDGIVVAMDVNEDFANIGKPYWKEAGVDKIIDLRIGPATDTLQKLIDNGETGTYDFAFIDADKGNYEAYYELCLKLMRPGGVIAVDNTLWTGKVIDPSIQDENTVALRNITSKIHADDRVDISMLWMGDGLTLAFKK